MPVAVDPGRQQGAHRHHPAALAHLQHQRVGQPPCSRPSEGSVLRPAPEGRGRISGPLPLALAGQTNLLRCGRPQRTSLASDCPHAMAWDARVVDRRHDVHDRERHDDQGRDDDQEGDDDPAAPRRLVCLSPSGAVGAASHSPGGRPGGGAGGWAGERRRGVVTHAAPPGSVDGRGERRELGSECRPGGVAGARAVAGGGLPAGDGSRRAPPAAPWRAPVGVQPPGAYPAALAGGGAHGSTGRRSDDDGGARDREHVGGAGAVWLPLGGGGRGRLRGGGADVRLGEPEARHQPRRAR